MKVKLFLLMILLATQSFALNVEPSQSWPLAKLPKFPVSEAVIATLPSWPVAKIPQFSTSEADIVTLPSQSWPNQARLVDTAIDLDYAIEPTAF